MGLVERVLSADSMGLQSLGEYSNDPFTLSREFPEPNTGKEALTSILSFVMVGESIIGYIICGHGRREHYRVYFMWSGQETALQSILYSVMIEERGISQLPSVLSDAEGATVPRFRGDPIDGGLGTRLLLLPYPCNDLQ